MKKIIYFAAALAVFAGCAKNEIAQQETDGTNNIALSVKVATEDGDTKAVFDGDKHIKFVANDKFYAALAKMETPRKAITVAKQPKGYSDVWWSTFTIADAAATNPVFDGTFYSVTEADKADKYYFYGVFPLDAVYTPYSEADLTAWQVRLPDDQTAATQTSWAPKTNVMLLKPSILTVNQFESNGYGEFNTVNNGEAVKFAHLFGYGKITFAGVPDEYKTAVVNTIAIEATGEDKNIVGRFSLDVTKPIDEIVLTPEDGRSTINLKGDGATTVENYVAWFAAKPGTYDVTITVETSAGKLIFERQGLEIVRSQIAAPTVNFKSGDKEYSNNVKLAEGENWKHTMTKSNGIGSYSDAVKEWGDGEKKMKFSLSYPGSTANNNGATLQDYDHPGYYAQNFLGRTLTGDKAVLSSSFKFSGIKQVKAILGNYDKDVTCKFTVSIVNDDKTYELGTVDVVGSNKGLEGEAFYFNTTAESETGQLVISVSDLSDKGSRPYLRELEINPAPEITLGETTVNASAAASENQTVTCTVSIADIVPTVAVSDDAKDWLTATYDNGNVVWSVTANDSEASREGVITVTAKGFSVGVATITVKQRGNASVTYKLSATAADFYPAIKAELDAQEKKWGVGGVESYETYPVTAKLTAEATNGSGKTKEVEVYMSNVYVATATESKFKASSQITIKTDLGEIKTVSLVSEYKAMVSGKMWFLLSKDSSAFEKFDATESAYDSNWIATNKLVPEDSYGWFGIGFDNGGYIYSLDITFVSE